MDALQPALEGVDVGPKRMPPAVPSAEVRALMKDMAQDYKQGDHGIQGADPQTMAAKYDQWVSAQKESYLNKQTLKCSQDLSPKQQEFARTFLEELSNKRGSLEAARDPAALKAARELAIKHGPQIENLAHGDKGVSRLAAETAVKAGNHVKQGAMTSKNLVEGARVGKGTFHLLREPRLETSNGAKDWTAHGVLKNEGEQKYGATAQVGEAHKRLPASAKKDSSLDLVLDLNQPNETVRDSLKTVNANRRAPANQQQQPQAGDGDNKVGAKMPKHAGISSSGTSSSSLRTGGL